MDKLEEDTAASQKRACDRHAGTLPRPWAVH
jgi:hypothetical protein